MARKAKQIPRANPALGMTNEELAGPLKAVLLRAIPKRAPGRLNSLKNGAVKYPVDEEHQGVADRTVKRVNDPALDPVADHDARQSDRARPHARSGVDAYRRRDDEERDGPDCGVG